LPIVLNLEIKLDIAIEALRSGIAEKKASFSEINKIAKIYRVQNVIRPNAETILTPWV